MASTLLAIDGEYRLVVLAGETVALISLAAKLYLSELVLTVRLRRGGVA